MKTPITAGRSDQPSSTSSPAVMWVNGPARAMPASVPRDSGFSLLYEA